MKIASIGIVVALIGAPPPSLFLEKVRDVDDPRAFDLRDPEHGDRGVPRSCSVSDAITLTARQDRTGTTIEIDAHGSKRTLRVENTAGLGRSTLTCGDGDAFYFVNPRLGTIYAYSVSRALREQDPVMWSRSVEPFRSLDDVGGILTDASIATGVQARQQLVLVEWFFRDNGTTGFWHEVLDAATGTPLEKIGPSDLLLKLNEHDPWWIAFQGGGNETANYVPASIYRLAYGVPPPGAQPAASAIASWRTSRAEKAMGPITKLSSDPVVNHMIALLTPTRTSTTPAVEFCPTVPGQRARYWLGHDYDPMLAEAARNVLLASWAQRQRDGATGNPIDSWFRSDVATQEPMKSLIARFNPQDDAWIAAYQQALLKVAGGTLSAWVKTFGIGTGAIIRVPDDGHP